jgi:hypothetical protein
MMNFIRQFVLRLFPTSGAVSTLTVRYAFSILFLALLVTGIASVVGSEQSSIVLESTVSSVVNGDRFTIDVFAVATVPVNAVSLTISFPADTVEVLSVDKGESVLTLWTDEPRVDGNTVILAGGTYRKGFVGKHQIATITARAKKTGIATFTTNTATLLAGDGRGSEVRTNITKDGQTEVAVRESTDVALEGDAMVTIVTDLNNDGRVTLQDVSLFLTKWGTFDPTADFNKDGNVSFSDFSIILYALFKDR